MKPIERLFEREGLPFFGLPPALATSYGGDFGITRPGLYANFVSSADGIVALAEAGGRSGRVISGDSEADRFVMALLRACADAVLIGAGTFQYASGSLWHAENVYPAAGQLFADLRTQLGLRQHPMLVILTASGHLDCSQPALGDSLVITTPKGQAHLAGTLPSGARIAVVDSDPIGGRALMDVLAAQNLSVVLTEGGPSLIGHLFGDGLVDELFLTTSPRLFGRRPNDGHKSLVEGVDLNGQAMDLVGVRRHESHLFLRYALASPPPRPTSNAADPTL
jgi:riboflavin biosynthesis pyrimidine reductase